jgi:hypothetical protein
MKQLVKNYTFSTSAKTITLTDFGTIMLDRIQLIIDVTTNKILYNFADSTVATATVATNVITLSTLQGGEANGDALQVIYEILTSDPVYDGGQRTMANSAAVVLASDQSSIPVAATLNAETTKVIGVVRTADGSGNLFTSTSNALDNNIKLINGVTPLMGAGNGGTGSLRVNIASDQVSIPVAATLGAETTKVIGTARIIGNAGGIVDGAPAATAPANIIQVGGQFVTTPTTLTTGQAGALQLTAAQNLKTDLTTIAGTAIDTNSGNKSAGTQRIVIATDQPNLTTPLNTNVAQMNGVATSMGNGATDTGTQRVTISNDSTGQVIALGNVASAASDSGNPVKVGGKYNSSAPSFTNGQRGDLQLTAGGNVKMTIYDSTGANNLTRQIDSGSDSSGSAFMLGVAAFNELFNGSSYDRQRANQDNISLLASSARTTTQTVADQTNYNARGVIVTLDVTSASSGSITLEIDYKDPVSGKYIALLTGAAVTGTGTTQYTVYPGITAATNVAASMILPRTWRVVVTANNSNSMTYSVGASLVV